MKINNNNNDMFNTWRKILRETLHNFWTKLEYMDNWEII